jgi:hypothetical protein
LHGIGRCQESIRQYKAAENAHQIVLELRKKVSGDDHPDILISMNKLAGALSQQGKYVEAEIIYCETLALSKKTSGDEHSHMLTSMGNLAGIFSY